MEWILLLTAMHINNPNNIPATVSMKFDTEKACLEAKNSVEYKIKYESYKMVAECQRKKS